MQSENKMISSFDVIN